MRERLGYAAQTPDLFEWMEVMEMIKVIGSAYPRWNETRALAPAVQLDLPVGRKISALSVGDQQKLSVVLALDASVAGVVCTNPSAGSAVVDTRRLPQYADAGRALGLDALFLELNA